MEGNTSTSPVTTPVLTLSLIRETLNPKPRREGSLHAIRDWGYRDAMLDASLAQYAHLGDLDEIDPQDWAFIARDVIAYGDCEWHATEWDDWAVANLEALADAMDDMDYYL